MDDFIQTSAARAALSPRLFDNALLDKLSRVHHLVPVFVYAPLVLGLLYFGHLLLGWATAGLGMLAGYAAWTLLEYFGHRFVFHAAFPGRTGARVHYLIHGVHHDHPSDPLRLVMPPLLSLPIMGLGFLVLRPICGPELVLSVWAGFIAGYVAYDMVHYHVHHARPRTRWGRILRRRHMLHHFHDDASWFGVSAPWWDEIFGTTPARAEERAG